MIRAVFTRWLRSGDTGATAVEFALIAPALILLIFGAFEGARAIWTYQTLQEVAYMSARCLMTKEGCQTTADAEQFARTKAQALGVEIEEADVVAEQNVPCKQAPNQVRIELRVDYETVISGMVPVAIDEMYAEACMPAQATR